VAVFGGWEQRRSMEVAVRVTINGARWWSMKKREERKKKL